MKDSYQTRRIGTTGRIATIKMSKFTNAEVADMHFVYGFCNGNSLGALREYQHQYPNKRQIYGRGFEKGEL
jgi:hypothetical protein